MDRRVPLNENTLDQERPLTVTRRSLIYVAGYLVLGGIGLLGWPRMTTEFLSSNVEYNDLLLRVTGLVMLSLGLVLGQIIRRKLESLYFWTLPTSGVLLICLIFIYVLLPDPLFLIVITIVGLGFVMTTASYTIDHGRSPG